MTCALKVTFIFTVQSISPLGTPKLTLIFSPPSPPSPRQPAIRPRPAALRRWTFLHKLLQSQIPPADLLLRLRRSCYPKGGVLVWHDVVFVFWVRRLVLWRHVDRLCGEVRGACEFLGIWVSFGGLI